MATSAKDTEFDAEIWRPGGPPKQTENMAGTSINPAPCAMDITKDQSASSVWPAGTLARFAL